MLVSPLRDQPWNDRKADVEKRAEEPPLIEAVLTPGDCLYLPRGYLHAATALGGGAPTDSWHPRLDPLYALVQLMEQALRVGDDLAIRASLPLGDVRPEPDAHGLRRGHRDLADAVQHDLDQMSRSLLRMHG